VADDITQEVVGVDQLRPAAAYLAGVDVAEGLRARGLDHRGVQAMSDPGMSAASSDHEWLTPGRHVEVRNRFTGSWSRGFELAEIVDGGFKVRRLSDGSVLPTLFLPEDVRPRPAKKAGLWWYR